MTVPEDTKYPKNLSNTFWQSKKTFKDKTKSATKTGLGAALTTAENAWKTIPWADLDASKKNPKDVKEAEAMLAAAKKAKTTQVKATMDALEKARLKALETAKNTALSPAAIQTAKDMANGLSKARMETLLNINTKDFDILVGRMEAKAQGGTHLQHTSIDRHGTHTELGSAAKAVRSGNTVTVANVTWTGGLDPTSLLHQTVTVHSSNEDGSSFVNDMVVNALSSDHKTVTLKAP